MRKILALLFLSLAGTAAQAAQPACNNMKIFLVPTNYSASTTDTVAFTARVQADTSGGGCDYFVTINDGSSSLYTLRSVKYGSYSWPYKIAKDVSGTQDIKSFFEGNSCSEFLCGTLPGGSSNVTKDEIYQFILDSSNQWRKYGSYSDNFTLRLYKGTPSSYQQADQANMNVTFMAAKKTDISIVDSGASFNIADTTQVMNFGSMSAGASRTADMIVKYNAGCTLYASSANNGTMKHATMAQTVAYTMTINGSTINLANTSGNPKTILTLSGVSPANGDVNPIAVTIGSITGKSPGTYSDTITFTVQSRE